MNGTVRLAAVLSVVAGLAPMSLAQWSSDTNAPLVIADVGSDNGSPQTIAAPDGGAYVLWRSGGFGGYDTRVQRLSPTGVEMWAHNGVLLGNSGSSSTIVGEADMALSPDGGVVVSFGAVNPMFPGARSVHAQKLSATGDKLWGASGVPVLNSTFDSAPAHIAAMPDGGAVLACTVALTPRKIYFMRLGPTGATASGWNASNPPSLPQDATNTTVCDLHSGPDGSFIVAWQVAGTQAQYKTQKFTGLGAPFAGWGSGFTLDNHGLVNHYFPTFIPDGAGGAIYAWQSYGSTIMFGQTSDALLQHIHADGTLQFPQPVPTVLTPYTTPTGSGDDTLGRYGASVGYDSVNQLYYVASMQGPRSNGVSNSVVVQKINASGTHLWTDSGYYVTLQAGAGNVACTATSDGCIVLGTMTRGGQVTRVNWAQKVVDDGFGGGTSAWGTSDIVFFNTDASTDKGRLSAARVTGGDDVIVAYGVGSSLSNNKVAAVRLNAATGAPGITPVGVTITTDLPATVQACAGDVVTLSVAASGTPNIAYRWYRHYPHHVSGNPDAAWALNDGDSSFGCVVPNDGTRYEGTNTPTLKIKGVKRLPAMLDGCTQPTDETLNAYRCAMVNVAGDTPVFSGWAQLVITGKCQADYSCDGNITIDDIFIFLNGWFASNPRTDYDHNGSITIDDIFIYLNAWFAGCP